MLKIYHNPKCRKSREGLEYLRSKTSEIEIVDYLKNGLHVDEMKEIILKSEFRPVDLIRKNEILYKKELKGKSFTDEEWIMIICENPKLLIRPIVLSRHKAVMGNPVENIDVLIKNPT
jgi:arsenate reductase (glutaredoxin)